jgi:O-antigen ligase
MAVVLACAPYAGWLTPWRWSFSIVEILLLAVGLLAVPLLWSCRAKVLSGSGCALLVFLVVAAVSSLHSLLRVHPYLDDTLAEQALARWSGRIALDQAEPLYTMRALATLLAGGLAYSCARLTGRHETARRWMLQGALLGAVLAAGWAVMQRLAEWDLPQHWLLHEPQLKRVGGPLRDPNLLGSLLCLTLPLLWCRARQRPVWWVAVALGSCSLVLTWSRAALGALALVALFLALDGRRRPVRFALALLGLIAGGWLLARVYVGSGTGGPLAAFLAKSASVPNSDRFLLGRLDLWHAGLQMISDFPWLGSGPGTVYGRLPLYGFELPENLHNYFLQVAAETGLVGFVAFAALLMASLRVGKAEAAQQASQQAFWLQIGAVAFLLTCLSGHPLLDPRMQILFWGLVGALSPGDCVMLRRPDHGGQSGASRGPVGLPFCFSISLSQGSERREEGPESRQFLPPAPAGEEAGVSTLGRNKDLDQDRRVRWRHLLALALAGLVIGQTIASVQIGRESVGGPGLYGVHPAAQPWPLAETLWPEISEHWWWMARNCRMRLPRVSEVLGLPVQVRTPDVTERPLPVDLYLDGELRLRTEIARPGVHRLFLRLHPSESGAPLVDLGVRVGRTWSPARAGTGSDDRDLGLALGKPVWYRYRPQPGLPSGFYPAEADEAGSRFHWTMDLAQARIRCPDSGSGTLVLRALVAHPDVESRPVRIRLSLDGQLVDEQRIKASGWLELRLPGVHDGSVLTLEVSRTWTPPGDPRQLGLRLSMPDSRPAPGQCGLDLIAGGSIPLPPLRRARLVGLDHAFPLEDEPS